MSEHFSLDFPVVFRRHPGAHQERGRVVGRTFQKTPRYDVETADGERLCGLTNIEADEDELQRVRESELGAIGVNVLKGKQ